MNAPGAPALQLSADDFQLFELPRRFTLDRDELDARWRGLQSQVHPDRFAAQGAAAQRAAVQWSVRVNEAYRRLRDPLARAAYLCELEGAALEVESNTAMPASFLHQQMAWREALDEARDLGAVEALAEEVQASEDALFDQVRMLLDERADAAAAAQHVRALMFVARFRSELDLRLDALGQ